MELRTYWEIFYRRRKLFLWVFGVILLTALLGALIYQYVLFGPVYSIPVQIRVDKNDIMGEFLTGAPQDFGKMNSDNFATNVLTIAESDAVMTRAGERLNLRTKGGKPYAPADFVNSGMLKVIFQGRGVAIANTENTEIIEIDGLSRNPKEAVEIANTFADELSKEIAYSNQKIARDAIQYFAKELPKIKEELTIAEDSVLEFRQKEHITDISSYRTQLIGIQTNFETTIYNAERQYKENFKRIKAVLDQLKKQPEFKLNTQTYQENPQIESLRQNLLSLERQLIGLLLIYTDEYQDVKSTRKQIEVTRNQLREQIDKTFAQENKARNSYFDTLIQSLGDMEIDQITEQARIEISKTQLKDVIDRLDDLTRKETEFNRVSRMVGVLNTTYTSYLSSLESAKAITQINVDNITFFSPAIVPTESSIVKTYIFFPKKKMILIIAIALGIIFGLTLVFVMDYTDDRIYTTAALRSLSGLPIAGLVSQGAGSSINVKSLDPRLKQQVKEIISHWKMQSNKAGKKESILSLTGDLSGEGKTSLAAALGIGRAESGEKVLVIDADILSSTLGTVMNVSSVENPMPETVEQARSQIVATNIANLSYLKVSSSPNWDLDKFSSVIRELQKQYSAIIIDTPPIGQSRFGAQISLLADQIYVVTRNEMTRPIHVRQVLDTLKETGVNPTGIVLNGVMS